MQIKLVDPDSSIDKTKFIQFPLNLYKGCSHWVPTMSSEMHTILKQSDHPFFKHSEADFFFVESEGEVLGRIAILQNKNYNLHHRSSTAFFYYFDAIDDTDVSSLLFQKGIEWAAQRDLSSIIGPRGFTRSSGIGMLVGGFDYDAAMGISYNFPYYSRLVEDMGFQKETDYLSGYLVETQKLDPRIYAAAEKIKQRGGYWVKTFKNKAEMRAQIAYINEVHDRAFQNNPGYYPSTPEEFNLVAETMIQIADPHLVKLIMKGDQIAGFIIAYANITKAIKATRGEMWPFGWISLLVEQNRTRIVDINGLGLLPEHQGMGANMLLYTELENSLRSFRFERAELVQVDERNFKSKSDMENMGVTWHKNHRLYRLNLESKP